MTDETRASDPVREFVESYERRHTLTARERALIEDALYTFLVERSTKNAR